MSNIAFSSFDTALYSSSFVYTFGSSDSSGPRPGSEKSTTTDGQDGIIPPQSSVVETTLSSNEFDESCLMAKLGKYNIVFPLPQPAKGKPALMKYLKSQALDNDEMEWTNFQTEVKNSNTALPQLESSQRRMVVLWMSEVCSELSFDRKTFQQALLLWDRCMATVAFELENVQELGLACLALAGKLNHPGDDLDLSYLISFCGQDSYLTCDLVAAEALALKVCAYDISPVTVCDWLDLILGVIETEQKDLLLRSCLLSADIFYCKHSSMTFGASEIAMALVMLAAKDFNIDISVLKEKFGLLAEKLKRGKCFKLLQKLEAKNQILTGYTLKQHVDAFKWSPVSTPWSHDFGFGKGQFEFSLQVRSLFFQTGLEQLLEELEKTSVEVTEMNGKVKDHGDPISSRTRSKARDMGPVGSRTRSKSRIGR